MNVIKYLLVLVFICGLVACSPESSPQPPQEPSVSQGEFDLKLSSASLSLEPSSTNNLVVLVGKGEGFSGNVRFSLTGLPAGVEASFSPNPSADNTTLTLKAANAAVGSSQVTVTGVSDGLERSAQFSLDVTEQAEEGFTLTLLESSATVTAGDSKRIGLELVKTAGFEETVSLTLEGAPEGVSGSFATEPVTSSESLKLEVAASVAPGAYPLVVRARTTRLERSATLVLNIRETAEPDPDNQAPVIAPIAAQTVRRNTLNPRSLSLQLDIQDADDESVSVFVDSDRENVIEDSSFDCAVGACRLTLTPSPEESARVTLRLSVQDGRGGASETSFVVDVVPALLVSTTADSGPGSLRELAANALPGEVIGFDPELFATPQVIVLSDQIVLDRDLTIEGGVDPSLVRLSGDNKTRAFRVNFPANVVLTRLTVISGKAQDDAFGLGGTTGGGILNSGGQLTLNQSLISQNQAFFGGGIYTDSGLLTLTNESRVFDNFASNSGGGIHNHRGDLVLEQSRISGNRASSKGGAIFSTKDGGAGAPSVPTVTIDSSIIGGSSSGEKNQAVIGGGIYNEDGKVTIQNGSRISGNVARSGGGIHNETTDTTDIATLIVDNSTIGGSNPDEANQSSGIVNVDGTVIIQNGSRIIGNQADFGGGIANSNRADTSHIATLTIDASTVADNQVRFSGGGGVFNASGHVTIQNGSLVSGNKAKTGGGIESITGDSSPEVANLSIDASTISGNSAEDGGGLRVACIRCQDGGVVTLQNGSVIADNEAKRDGGGIHAEQVVVRLDETSRITGNTADADNDANGSGGALFTHNSLLEITGTISGNAPAEPRLALSIVSPISRGDVTVTGPNAFSQRATVTTDMDGLEPGNYTLEARAVTVRRFERYVPLPPNPRTVTILPESTTAVTVEYVRDN